jgi:F0F1-type ATP synthase delta subunit
MMPFVIIIGLQVVIAGVVVIFLKQRLDRELEKAAIEKIMSLKNNSEVKAVNIYSAKNLPTNIAQELGSIAKNKFSNARVAFEILEPIKGGLMIKVDEEVLDFSLSSRLENFWL